MWRVLLITLSILSSSSASFSPFESSLIWELEPLFPPPNVKEVGFHKCFRKNFVSTTRTNLVCPTQVGFLLLLTKVIKIAIQILKSYDFKIQNMVDDSVRDSRRFYTFLLTSENLASLNHANKENMLVIANIVGKQLFFPIFGSFNL